MVKKYIPGAIMIIPKKVNTLQKESTSAEFFIE